MADLTQTFALELEDLTTGPARSAATALADYAKKAEEGQARLASLKAALAQVTGGSLTNVSAARQLQAEIAKQSQAVADARAQYALLGGTFGATAPKQKSFLELARMVPGPLGSLAGKVGNLQELLGTSAGRFLVAASAGLVFAGALVAGAAAGVAITAAIAAATVALVRYGIAAADAHRSEVLHLEGLVAVRALHHRTSESAAGLESAIGRVSSIFGLGRERTTAYAESLNRAGLRGADLEAALEGVSIAAAAGGEAEGRRFLGMAAGAARTGRSVRALVDDIRTRLGPVAARMAVSLDSQWTRLREGIASIFGGPRVASAIERFLTGLNRITAGFTSTSSSGRALRSIVEAIFPSILDEGAAAAELVRGFFLRAVIAAQRATIFFLDVRLALRGIGTVPFSRDALLGVMLVAAPAIASVAAAVWFAREGFSALSTQLLVGVAIWGAVFAAIGRTATFLSELDWRAEGAALVDGLVAGIESGAADLMTTIRELAGDATNAFRSALGIASPSRVFAELGLNVSRGVAAGVDAGAPEARRAVADVVEVPSSFGGSRGVAGGGSEGARVLVSIDQIIVQTQATDATGIATDIGDAIIEKLEELGLALGGEPT